MSLYEHRTYDAQPGKLADLHARFRDHTVGIFGKNGIEVVGFWDIEGGDGTQLHYLLRFPDAAARDAAWAAFRDDPAWHAARDNSERNGPLVAKVVSELWRPTDYSPLQ